MQQFPIPPKYLICGVVAVLLVAWVARPEPTPIEAGPFDPPVQIALDEPFELGRIEDFRITALDEYSMTAMVMSRERYWIDTQARVSPVDLLLAWGPVTREPNLSGIEFSQDGRWGNSRFRFDAINIKPTQISLSTANTHMIPEIGNRKIRKEILRARRGDILSMSGYLVRVDGPDGWYWESSRTRRDFGNRACEIFYVTQID